MVVQWKYKQSMTTTTMIMNRWYGGCGVIHAGNSARCSALRGQRAGTSSTAHMGTCRQQTKHSYWPRDGHSSSLIGWNKALSFPSSEGAFRAHATRAHCLIAKPVWHSEEFLRNLIVSPRVSIINVFCFLNVLVNFGITPLPSALK